MSGLSPSMDVVLVLKQHHSFLACSYAYDAKHRFPR
jgi:hypothetical protein